MATSAELFALALRHHQHGDLDQAENFYREILLADPGQANTHANLGILLQSTERELEALACFHAAACLDPENADNHNNLGNNLKFNGRLPEALACYRQALRLNPDHASAHNNLGIAYVQLDRLDAATECFEQAIRCKPNYMSAHINLGNICHDRGHLEKAAAAYREALRINPNRQSAKLSLDAVLTQLGRQAEEVASFRAALVTNPTDAQTHYELGNALVSQGRVTEAIACFRQAIYWAPQKVDAYNNLGSILVGQGQVNEGLECYGQGLSLDPNHADLHNNLGLAFHGKGQYEDAARCFQKALTITPDHIKALNNLGNALKNLGQFADAFACYHQVLATVPGHPITLWNVACLRLLHGDFAGGCTDYEQRWILPGARPVFYRQPRWDGSPLEGKTIFLYAEQGLGDTIQFLRFAAQVKKRGGKVFFECQPALMRLLSGLPWIDRLLCLGQAAPPFDVQAPLLSLPGILGTTLETLPADVPYIRLEPELVRSWREKIDDVHGFKIGIVWQGNPKQPEDNQRSVPLRLFASLAEIPGVSLVSLQVGPGAKQLPDAPFPIFDLAGGFDPDSLHDLAAVLPSLDLVITVCTSVAHLAGALGINAWIALRFVPYWSWLLERPDSPWYPTLRLFRQEKIGDWSEVFERMAADLRKLLKNKSEPGA